MTSCDPSSDVQFIRLADPREWSSWSVLLAGASGRQEPRQRRPAPSAPSAPRPLSERVADARRALYGSRAETQQRAREVRESMQSSGRR